MRVLAYVLEAVDGEYCLVVRTSDTNLLYQLVRRMTKMRDKRLKEIGQALERDLDDKQREKE